MKGKRRGRFRLASASPRRALLLPLLGFPVERVAVEADERQLPGESPVEMVVRLAMSKAEAVGRPRLGEIAVGADTTVVLEGTVLGKPSDAEEARRMLRALRGRSHQVISGIALEARSGDYSGVVSTRVVMRAYADGEITSYLASGRALDTAGAYAIQDRDFGPVERIEGCYVNVVGLPLCEVVRGLRALGWSVGDEPLDPPCRWCTLGKTALEEVP